MGLRINVSAPSTTILCKGNSLLYRRNFSTAPLETHSGVDIRAQLKTVEACNRYNNIDSVQSAITILTHFESTNKYDNIRDYSTRSFYTCLLRVGYSP